MHRGDALKMKDLAREERTDLAAFLATLTPAQWEAPSLCEGWRVRDVVAHMISYDDLTGRGLATRFAKGRFNLNKINAVGLAAFADYGPEQLVQLVEDHLTPRGLTAMFGGMVALVDGLVHHQDIRRPLGLPREIPAERMRRGLKAAMVAPPVGAFWRGRGLRLVATDIDFTTGSGHDLRGPAEALLMAVAGRRGITSELSGPGQPILHKRIET
jgi:uncharacterized protein (TIGR03083 family)